MRSLFLLSTVFLALAACGDDSSIDDVDMSTCTAVTCPMGEVAELTTCSCKPVVDMAKHD